MSEFDRLVSTFETLVEKSADLKGNDLRANRKAQKETEQLLASLAETGLDYNTMYADCRDIGHQWEEVFSEWEGNELVRLHRCERCGSERLDAYSRTGAVVNRRYDYNEGYLLDGEAEGIREKTGGRRRYWRTVNIQRAIKS
jgi:hypothetical protein